AVVTGASKGIGLHTALQLVKEGANVAICARNKSSLEEAKTVIKKETGKEVLAIVADVTKEEDCKRLIEETVKQFGKLNILVNNAGTSAAYSFEEVDTELWVAD